MVIIIRYKSKFYFNFNKVVIKRYFLKCLIIFLEFGMFLLQLLIVIPGIYLAVIPHEVMHGYIAMKNGDYTAKNMGRLTMNPLKHIDIFGSIIMPLLLILLDQT